MLRVNQLNAWYGASHALQDICLEVNKGEIVWKVPLGEGSQAIRNHPLLKGVTLPDRLGSPTNGGATLTGSGLIFIGGGDGYLYALDKRDGKELWRGIDTASHVESERTAWR